MKERLVDFCAVDTPTVRLYAALGLADGAWSRTRLLLLDAHRRIGYHDVNDRMVSVAAGATGQTLVAVAMSGLVTIARDGDVSFEQIDGPGTGRGRFGYCKRIRFVGTTLWVCGDMRQVYERTATGWARRDETIREEDPRAVGCSLNDLHGASESEIVAVGDRGAIFNRRAGQWRICDSPTNVALERVHFAGGVAWACGASGTLLRGDGDRWEVVAAGKAGSSTFWGLTIYKGDPWVAGSAGVFVFRDTALHPIDLPTIEGAPYRLVSDESTLWLSTTVGIWKFDGVQWQQMATA